MTSQASVSAEEEKKGIKGLLDNAKLKLGTEWYVVNYKWWQLWKFYVHYDSEVTAEDDHPRPDIINNVELLEDPSNPNKLKQGLREEYDYTVVPKEVWTKLKAW
jgi:hypothetical protein